MASRRRAVGLGDLEHGADIVLDVQAAEDRRLLRQVADARAARAGTSAAGDVLAVEQHLPGVGGDQAGDDVEAGGLAGAVRPEQADGLAAVQPQRDVAQHRAAAIVLGQTPGREGGSPGRRPLRGREPRRRLSPR